MASHWPARVSPPSREDSSPLDQESMSRNLSMLHHDTDWYRLLVTGSGSERSSAPANLQKASTIDRSTLRVDPSFSTFHSTVEHAVSDAISHPCDHVVPLAA